MTEEYKLPSALETMPVDYWFPKFVISSLLLISVPLFFNEEHPLSAIVCMFLLILSLMFMSLTRIKPEAEVVRYRRFFRWQAIPYTEVIACDTFWILGSIRSKRHIFPWGRIYFVLPRGGQEDYRWDKGIISFMRRKAGLIERGDQ
jgi:predicted ABC-type exoprotein transport system permease subunit